MRDSAGFSLVEVMVAGALLMVGGLVLVEGIRGAAKVSGAGASSVEWINVTSSMNQVLRFPDGCAAVLGGRTFTPAYLPMSISSFNLPGSSLGTVGMVSNGIKMTQMQFDRIWEDLGPQPCGFRGYIVNLHVEADKVVENANAQVVGGKLASHDFRVALFTDTSNRIRACHSGKMTSCIPTTTTTTTSSSTTGTGPTTSSTTTSTSTTGTGPTTSSTTSTSTTGTGPTTSSTTTTTTTTTSSTAITVPDCAVNDDCLTKYGTGGDIIPSECAFIYCNLGERMWVCNSGVCSVVGTCQTQGPPCFVSGSPILLADGGMRAIEKIQPGDLVQAGDPEAGRTESRRVVRVSKRKYSGEIWSVRFDDGSAFKGTPMHRIWATDRRGRNFAWRAIRDLDLGSKMLKSVAGKKLSPRTVVSVKKLPFDDFVFNFEVEGLHTYFVDGMLVHNFCVCP